MIEIIGILAIVLSTFYITDVILTLCNIWRLKLHITKYSIDISWKSYLFLGHKYFPVNKFKHLIKFTEDIPSNPF